MKPKIVAKAVTDALMTVAMLLLMGYQFFGDIAHELIGTGVFLLFILHHALNFNWYKNLFRGKYTTIRSFQTIVNILVLAAMLGLMVSGIMLSTYVFDFLHISGGAAFARELHVAATHWGFILMAMHLGLHWNMFVAMIKRAANIQNSSRVRSIICFLVATVIAVYGAFVFFNCDFPLYMTLKIRFVFLDFEESPIRFYLDYISMAGTFVWIGHYASKLMRKFAHSKKQNNSGKEREER